jgi:RHS repeat-associated protein
MERVENQVHLSKHVPVDTMGTAIKVSQVNDYGVNSITTLYFIGSIYEVKDPGLNQTITKYYAMAGMTVAMDDGSNLMYFLTDHLGSIVEVFDDTGGIFSEERYLPFGKVRTDIGPAAQTDFGYIFQRNLPEMGLMDYKARFYNPCIMEFQQPDTVGMGNRYAYVYNNPINFNDPSGHGVCDEEGNCYLKLGERIPNLTSTLTKIKTIYVNKSDMSSEYSKTRDVSQQGVEFIFQMEGFVPELYNDPAGNCTIGVGHLVHMGNCNGDDSEIEFLNQISQNEALLLFINDLTLSVEIINQQVSVPLTQAQFDALVSLVYNIGSANFTGSDLLGKLNSGNYASVPSEISRWVYIWDQDNGKYLISPGLQRRRAREAELFSTGIYGPW